MKFLVLILFSISFYSYSGLPERLSNQDVGNLGISVVAWDGKSQKEKESFQKSYLCTPLTVRVPEIVPEHIENDRVTVTAYVYVGDKVLMSSEFSKPKKVENTSFVESKGCVPLQEQYRVSLFYSYKLPDLNIIEFCPPTFEINDLDDFIKSVYNKPIKRD